MHKMMAAQKVFYAPKRDEIQYLHDSPHGKITLGVE
jgi:hypothetical protein